MKHRRILGIVMLIVLALSAGALVACNNTPETPPTPPAATQYTVTFAGEGVSTPSQQVNAGELAQKPTDPTREGYAFLGWFVGGEKYDFSTPVTADLTLTAKWEHTAITGQGTKESPYILDSKANLSAFAEAINEGGSAYADAGIYVRLDADIDFGGEAVTPIGVIGTDKTAYDNVFKGYFDGDGHTIENFAIRATASADCKYAGLFTVIYEAEIKNLSLKNFTVSVTDAVPSQSFIAGGIVGQSVKSNIRYCSVEGAFAVDATAEASVYVGGIVGYFASGMSGDMVGVVYFDYNAADITITSNAQSGMSGGIAGVCYDNYGAIMVANSYAVGTVVGGSYAGGITGYASDYTAFINCYSTASVKANSVSQGIAGGLVGGMFGNCLIMDCYAAGSVTANKATSTGDYSYAGEIVGLMEESDYLPFFVQGSAVVNSYYNAETSVLDCPENGSEYIYGEEVEVADEAFFRETLGFTDEDWVLSATPTLKPEAGKTIEQYTLTLMANGSEWRTYQIDKGAIIGALPSVPQQAPFLFYDWAYETEEDTFRIYTPMYKDLTLVAIACDASEVAGTYALSNNYNDVTATIELTVGGAFNWYSNGGCTGGSYTYDGDVIYASSATQGDFTIMFGIDENPDNATFYLQQGQTYVTFTMAPTTPDILGVYFSESGITMVFAGNGTMYMEKDGAEFSGTYTKAGNTLSVTLQQRGSNGATYTGTIDATDESALAADLTANNGSSPITETFERTSANHANAPYLGTYHYTTITLSSNVRVYPYTLTLSEDGSAQIGSYSGKYYYLESAHIIKIEYYGYYSTLYYDESADMIYGMFNTGTSTKSYTLYTRNAHLAVYATSDGAVRVTVTESTTFVITNNEAIDKTATVDISEEFGDTLVAVTIGGNTVRYLLNENLLVPVGVERGAYTVGSRTFRLDGHGIVSSNENEKIGMYWKLSENRIVVWFDDDGTVLCFDHTASSPAPITLDSYAGVYYSVSGNYRVIVSGVGTIWQLYDYGGEWRVNFTGEYTIDEPAGGVLIFVDRQYSGTEKFNLLVFNADKTVISASFNNGTPALYTKAGYKGSTAFPSLPSGYAKTWKDADNTLTITASGNATFNGRSLTGGIYNGSAFVFRDGTTVYGATLSGNTLTLKYGSTTLTLGNNSAPAGPTNTLFAQIAGTYTGKESDRSHKVEIGADGTVIYTGSFGVVAIKNIAIKQSGNDIILTFISADYIYEYTFTYSSDKITFKWVDDEGRNATADMTKQS